MVGICEITTPDGLFKHYLARAVGCGWGSPPQLGSGRGRAVVVGRCCFLDCLSRRHSRQSNMLAHQTSTTMPTHPAAPRADEFQSAVISSRGHSILVRSCAGSGKSTTLAARAGALIAGGVPPECILVLTFSVRSKLDLETKMQRLCSSAPGGAPRVMTHHAKALAILRAAGCSARVIEAREQRKMMRDALSARKGGAPSREAQREGVRNGLTLIARCKGLGSAPPQGSDDRAVLEAYQAALRASGQIDFEDMIILATQALRENQAADTGPASPFEHLLLDEAQDTSDAQLALLQLLAPRGIVSVTAVGDADQTIYSFRGSRPDVLSRIGTWWRCQTLVLPTNYRCGGAIVAAARTLIESSSLREAATPLLAARNLADVGAVHVHAHATRHEEMSRMAIELRELQVHWPSGGAAVLCRTRAQVAEVAEALKAAGVRVAKHEGASDSSSALRQRALDVLAYLRLCFTPTDDDAFTTAIQLPPRTGFASTGGTGSAGGAGGTGGAGFTYLRAYQRQMHSTVPPASGSRGESATSLLQAALAANGRNYPSVGDASGQAQSLTRAQQAALRGFLTLVHSTREHALHRPPAAVLEWLSGQVGLSDVLDKARKKRRSQQRAFTVRVPGEPAPARVDSSDDEGEDASDEDALPAPAPSAPRAPLQSAKRALGATFGDDPSRGAPAAAPPSRAATAAITSLMRTASEIGASFARVARESGCGGGGVSERALSNAALSTFCDALMMASHEATAGGVAERMVLVTTIHQSKGLEWDDVHIPLLTEGSLPLRPRGLNPNSLELVEHLEEERRLCYVAFTRARRTLTLSWAAEGAAPPAGATHSAAHAPRSKPSRFLPPETHPQPSSSRNSSVALSPEV